jgi:tetratricopeptide (TPR) repeat protein
MMRIFTLLLGLLLLAPLCVAADAGDSSDNPWNKQSGAVNVTADYEAGYRMLKAGDYESAIKSFQQVLAGDPKHAMAYTNMAYAYRKLGRYKKAVALYEKALAIEPNLAAAHEYMGEALLGLGRIDEAKKHLAILEKLDPKLADELRADIQRHEGA